MCWECALRFPDAWAARICPARRSKSAVGFRCRRFAPTLILRAKKRIFLTALSGSRCGYTAGIFLKRNNYPTTIFAKHSMNFTEKQFVWIYTRQLASPRKESTIRTRKLQDNRAAKMLRGVRFSNFAPFTK